MIDQKEVSRAHGDARRALELEFEFAAEPCE
jgi:hypothetical protein